VVREKPIREDSLRTLAGRGDRRDVGLLHECGDSHRHTLQSSGRRRCRPSRAGVSLWRSPRRQKGAGLLPGNVRGRSDQLHHGARLCLRAVELQRRLPERGRAELVLALAAWNSLVPGHGGSRGDEHRPCGGFVGDDRRLGMGQLAGHGLDRDTPGTRCVARGRAGPQPRRQDCSLDGCAG